MDTVFILSLLTAFGIHLNGNCHYVPLVQVEQRKSYLYRAYP